MLVRVTRWRLRQRPSWQDRAAQRCDVSPVGTGEPHRQRLIRVAGDVELAPMVTIVMERAQTPQIPRVSGAAVCPVDQMMHLQEPVRVTGGEEALSISILDQPPSVRRHDPHRTTHVDRATLGLPNRRQPPITGHLAQHGRRKYRTGVDPATGGVEVHVDAIVRLLGASVRHPMTGYTHRRTHQPRTPTAARRRTAGPAPL